MKREFRNEPGIYKITNLLNSKIYIGQSVKLLSRISAHKSENGGGLLSKAITKYGKDNFLFEVLEYCNKDDLDELEIKYISEYNSTVPNGYNISIGGKYPIYESEEIKNAFTKTGEDHFWFNKNLPKEIRDKMSESNSGVNNTQAKQVEDITGRIWGCLKDCANELDVSDGALSSKLNKRPTRLPHLDYLDLHFLENRPENYIFKTMEEIEHLKTPKKTMTYKKPKDDRNLYTKAKKVISNDGRIWNSVSECAIEFGLTVTSLSRILKGLRNPVEEIREFQLQYENPENSKRVYLTPKPKTQKRSVRRQVIDKDGNVYPSIRKCAECFQIGENLLSAMLREEIPFYKRLVEFDLKYVDSNYKENNWKDKPSLGKSRIGTTLSDETKKKISDSLSGEKHPQCKKVVDKNGNIWNSCQSAAKELKINQQSLGQMLLGNQPFRGDLIELGLKYAP